MRALGLILVLMGAVGFYALVIRGLTPNQIASAVQGYVGALKPASSGKKTP